MFELDLALVGSDRHENTPTRNAHLMNAEDGKLHRTLPVTWGDSQYEVEQAAKARKKWNRQTVYYLGTRSAALAIRPQA